MFNYHVYWSLLWKNWRVQGGDKPATAVVTFQKDEPNPALSAAAVCSMLNEPRNHDISESMRDFALSKLRVVTR